MPIFFLFHSFIHSFFLYFFKNPHTEFNSTFHMKNNILTTQLDEGHNN
jgi:hypothetical protein